MMILKLRALLLIGACVTVFSGCANTKDAESTPSAAVSCEIQEPTIGSNRVQRVCAPKAANVSAAKADTSTTPATPQ
jgi:hypothetical protein